jgi:glutamyl-tRNA synthetase
VGGARTALFNYLFARHHGGAFILRIEDTDRGRYQQDALREIFQSLRWLGLDWDEGPEAGGEAGPYVQSERGELYARAARDLIERGRAYRCFCTAERLAEVRQEREKQKLATSYDRRCRALSQTEIKGLVDAGTPFVVRLKTPDATTIAFEDAIRGEISYRSDILDDMVLLKSDGFPTYHLASVVDDHHMGITHVLRGDEWIASTPRHLLLYEALGWTPPKFAHLPVILAPGGGKLSKRKGAASVMDYQQAGYLPETLVNFLALLGWSPGDDREKMSREELIAAFSLERVSPKAAVFDEKKLEWMNGAYMQERDVDSLAGDIVRRMSSRQYVSSPLRADDPFVRTVIGLLKNRSRRLDDIADGAAYFFVDPRDYDPKGVRKHFKGDAARVLTDLAGKIERATAFDEDSLEKLYRDYAEEYELPAGKLIHPTRLAVSGVTAGPGVFELLAAVGKERVVARMRAAVRWMEEHGAASAPSQENSQ